MPAFALEIEHGIDHMLDDPGAGDLAFLGHVPDQNERGAGCLGPARELLSAGANLADTTRSGFETVRPHGLNGIDHDKIRFGRLQGCEDFAKIGLRGELNRAVSHLQSARAILNLRGGFFAGDIDRGEAISGEPRGHLQEQGRFPNARVAPNKRCAGWHDAAAKHSIQFVDAEDDSFWWHIVAIERRELGLAAALGPRLGGFQSTWRTGCRLFDQRVPFSARITAPRPFGMDCAAGLTNKMRFRHPA